MAIMLTRRTRSSREHFVGAINDTGLYTKAASSLTGTSAYWRDVVERIEQMPAETTVHQSFYQTENVQEDERPVVMTTFIEAPPDDTDW